MTDTANQIKTYPPPEALATPAELNNDAVQEITETLNNVIADALAVWVKTKNYHWHMSGSHFRDYHLLLDDMADSIMEAIDPLAERIRRIGGTTIRSISHIAALQSVEDSNEEFVPPGEMMKHLVEDNRHLAKTQRKAHQIADDNQDAGTAGLLEDTIDETERRIWFMWEVTRGEDNTA